VDTKTKKVMSRKFITDGTDKLIEIPYGIAVHPETKEIFVTDAKDYVTPGKLYCFTPDGKKKWEVTTGDIPAHIVFTRQKLE
jgi:outer membrane protein assembly factor BamB